jgi:hypothetical protein
MASSSIVRLVCAAYRGTEYSVECESCIESTIKTAGLPHATICKAHVFPCIQRSDALHSEH